MKVYVVYSIEILNMADDVIADIEGVTLTPPTDAIPDTDNAAIQAALNTDGIAKVYREMETLP